MGKESNPREEEKNERTDSQEEEGVVSSVSSHNLEDGLDLVEGVAPIRLGFLAGELLGLGEELVLGGSDEVAETAREH